MGITLHAVIEERWTVQLDAEGRAVTRGLWTGIGTWDFGKDYESQRFLHEHASKGWPADVSYEAQELNERGADQGRSHGDSKLLRRCKRTRMRALVAALDVLEKDLGSPAGYRCRVLFYEM